MNDEESSAYLLGCLVVGGIIFILGIVSAILERA